MSHAWGFAIGDGREAASVGCEICRESRVMHRCAWLSWLVSICVAPFAWSADEPSLAEYYGFQNLEVFKLSERMGSLLAGDFNHDGRTDLVIANNQNHRLDLLLQRSAPPETPVKSIDDRINSVTDHWRFELVKLPVDHDVAALAIGDFNGDGRQDLAYFGAPDQLVIRYQPESGPWTSKHQVRVPDVQPGQWCIAAGDLNHDGTDDLVVLGKRDTILLLQQPKGTIAPPVRLMNTSDKLGLAQVADLDGDGRADLCYLAGETTNRSMGVRLQDAQGRMGPEYIFDLERPRAVSIREIDGQPGQEILTIDMRTGRLKILKLKFTALGEKELPERLVRYGFGASGSGRDRDWAIGDFDGDGRVDIAVSDPDGSQVLLFRQTPDRGLDLGAPFPSVAGADALRALPHRNGQGSALVVQSKAEKSIGVSDWQEQRLRFPTALPLDVEPVGMEVLNIAGDAQPEIVFLARTGKGRDAESSLFAYRRDATDAGWEPLPNYPVQTGLPTSVKGTPDRLLAADVTNDGKPELLVLQGSKPPAVFKLKEDGLFSEMPVSGTLSTGSIAGSAVFPCGWKGSTGVLVTQDNFARMLKLGTDSRWQVADQFNAGEGGAKIVGGAVLQLESGGDPELALVDAGVKKLRLYKHDVTPWKEIDLGDLDFKSAAVADFNGDRRDDLALFGTQQLAVLYSGGIAPKLEEVASFETPLEKTFLSDVVAGDINGDGKTDLVLIDTRSRYVEVLQFRPPNRVQHATYFTVFEQKSLTGSEGPGSEPREALIADVTGDGRADLVLLAHDRLLVYPQDPGGSVKTTKR
jgi:hypothetical protein